MTYFRHISTIARLAEREGIFTTAQAERMGIPRDALHDAMVSGRISRVTRGAYRLVDIESSNLDELIALWKLTAPKAFSRERNSLAQWDGFVIGGLTAACLWEVGDGPLAPYRMFGARRFNSRNAQLHFSTRRVAPKDVTFLKGLPVTRPERTVFDLIIDRADRFQISRILREFSCKYARTDDDFNLQRLMTLLGKAIGREEATSVLRVLLLL